MNTYQFVIAILASVPALLTAIGAFWHSLRTREQFHKLHTDLLQAAKAARDYRD